MDSVLVFPLILALLSPGQSNTKVNGNSCHVLCPPGYKVGHCRDPVEKHRCEKCENNTFSDRENSTPKCETCNSCNHYEVEKKPCSYNEDVVCDCVEGYYDASSDSKKRDCQPCPCGYCQGLFNKTGSQHCDRILNYPQCKRKCIGTTNPSTIPSATPSITTTTTATATSTTASKTTPNPDVNPVSHNFPWPFLVGVVVIFLVLFWLLLLFTEKPIRYPDSCPCWRANKDLEPPVEDPKYNEQFTHQDSSPATMILNSSEETLMLNLSQTPAKPEHPANITPLLPGAEHKAARQDEQSEHWPAIVLYAIIKEVPLRRWKEFLRLLSVADQQLERVELEASLGSMERQYQMLRLWSQRSSASLSDIFSALHYMDLSGCAQLLQESLEKLQWRPELKQGFTDHGSSGVMQDT